MLFRLRLSKISSLSKIKALESGVWDVKIAAGEKSSRARLSDPFADSTAFGKDPESAVRWYFENYITEPFEATKADFAAEALFAYGRDLAAQIVRSGLLPKNGDIEIEIQAIDGPRNPGTDDVLGQSEGRDLQHLHWEVLEDLKVWPPGHIFESVSIIRSVRRTTGAVSGSSEVLQGNKFKILLVVSRPGQDTDLDYQLVSRSLVVIISHVSETKPGTKVSLKILRPPTWRAFQEDVQKYDYDLVHLDMHGRLNDVQKRSATYVWGLCFSFHTP